MVVADKRTQPLSMYWPTLAGMSITVAMLFDACWVANRWEGPLYAGGRETEMTVVKSKVGPRLLQAATLSLGTVR